jgi:ribosomal protein L40E
VETVNVAARCPACNAALRADAQWCSLCHHDLRPAPEPTAPVQAALQEWPCTSCGARNPLSMTICSVCGSAFLAAAQTQVSLVVPGVGDLQHLSRGQRIAVAGGVLALVLVPLAAITFFLTPEPPKQPAGGSTDTTVTIVK